VAGGPGGRLDFYSEYIDLSRFPDPVYQAGFRDFLRVKYTGRRFDVIVAVQDVAVEFLAKHRNDLFPGTPFVFLTNTRPGPRPENSTGIVAGLSFGGTLVLAAALQPAVRHVFVVSGASARDQVYETAARAQLQQFESSVTITYLSGLATKDLEARLRRLPPNSIVYFLIVYRDGAGEFFAPLEFLDRVTAVANAPVYSWVDSAMGHGIVGGRLRDQQAQAAALSHLVLRVLRGERADSIPLSSPDPDVNQVDWRQLKRWGISEARVPPGTRVNFREPSPWERYSAYILGAVAVLLIQTGLILGLLVQGRRRRRAEEEVRGSEAQLRTTHRRIKDLASRLLSAQEAERSRIARELHDDISQQLALLTIDLELLARGGGPAHLDGLVHEAVNRAQEIATSVHDLSHRLHPAKLRLVGLASAVQALLREVSQDDIDVTFTHHDIPSTLAPELTLCLFRIVQEALQNAVKYSQAKTVSVHLARTVRGLTLSILDDGIGFDVNAAWGSGLGLVSMRERLDAIGGVLEIHSERGVGTRLMIWAPLLAAEDTNAAAS
jgi:signal transduction histidine kinase